MKFFTFIRQLISKIFPFSKKARSRSPASTSWKTSSPSHTPSHSPKADKEEPLSVSSQKSLHENPRGYTKGQLPVEESELMVEHQQRAEGSISEAGLKHQKEDLSIPGLSNGLEEKVNIESELRDQGFGPLMDEAVDPNQEMQHDLSEAPASDVSIVEATSNLECQGDAPVDVDQSDMSAETIEPVSETLPQHTLPDIGTRESTLGRICEVEAIHLDGYTERFAE